jgi:hypothetical protein
MSYYFPLIFKSLSHIFISQSNKHYFSHDEIILIPFKIILDIFAGLQVVDKVSSVCQDFGKSVKGNFFTIQKQKYCAEMNIQFRGISSKRMMSDFYVSRNPYCQGFESHWHQ